MPNFTSFELDDEPSHTLEMPATMCFSEGMLPEDCLVIEFAGPGGRIKVEGDISRIMMLQMSVPQDDRALEVAAEIRAITA